MAAAVALPLSVSLVIFIDCEDAFALGCWCLHSPIKPYARPPIMSRRTAAVIRTPCLCRLILSTRYSALEVAGAEIWLVPTAGTEGTKADPLRPATEPAPLACEEIECSRRASEVNS